MHRAITAALTRGRSVLARAGRSCVSAGVVGLVLAGGSYLHHVNVTTIALLLVLAVLCIALVWGWLEALVAAVVAGLGLNYFFLPPRGSFSMDNPQHWVDLLAFLVTALATGQLSARELEILALLSEGLANKEIADRLKISFATVRTHLMHIYEKLHVRCRTEAAAKYLRSQPGQNLRPVGLRS